MQFEEFALKMNVLAFAIKGLSKTTKTYLRKIFYKNCTYVWKNLDWHWTTRLFLHRLSGVQNNWSLFFVIYFEKKMERSNSGDWKIIFGTNLSTLNIGLMKGGRAKWQEAEVTRKDFNIVLIHQGSSRSFRTQSHWSFITGQCANSGQFLRVHLSHRMCDHFTCQDKFRIDTGRTFGQKKDSILWSCETHGQGTQRSVQAWLDQTTSCVVQAERVEETSRHGVIGVDLQLAQQKGFKFCETRSNAIILYDTLTAYCIPKVILMETGETEHEKVFSSPRPPPEISCKDNWMKELGSEVAGGSEDSQQIQPTLKTQLLEQGDLFCHSNNPVRVFRKSKMSAPMKEQGDLFMNNHLLCSHSART